MLAKHRPFVGLLAIGLSALLVGALRVPAASLPKESAETGDQFKHGKWPFLPPTRPAVPDVQKKAWVRNPIDAFVLHKLEAKGLQPSREAEKLVLLRRVTFDLIGLPPTPEEQATFLADESPRAYEEAVERLLGSPRYGERWAQHWLDLVRYAETDGFKEDAHRPNAHKYRDYVIRAFNCDLPYDRFIRQQLAGDELEPDNPEALIATGYCRLYPDEYNAADIRLRRKEILDDVTDTTGLVVLGLTMGCAQCHNHKFDDILQTDYYRLQAFFTPMLPRDDLPDATVAQREEFAKQQAAWETATAGIRLQIESIVAPGREKARDQALMKFDAEAVKAVQTPPAERTAIQKQIAYQVAKYTRPLEQAAATKLAGDEKKRYEELQVELAKFDAIKPQPLPMAMAISDADAPPPPTFRLAGGSLNHPAEQVEPGFPEFLGTSQIEIAPPAGNPNSTGRRSALATWLTRKDHPLTARIIANRLWQYHFGQGIVATPNDFGAAGEPPTHPELLDWLAVELMDSGWSLKAMHRLMVTSATYRQSAMVEPENELHKKARGVDPSNKLLWHARRQRLSGESLRDAILQVGGDLDLRMYGPSVHPELPDGLGNYAWKPDPKSEDRNRRSIYVIAKRNLRLPLLDAFDLPDMHNSCARRSTTTTAPQALLMLNSEFTLGEARRWAARLIASVATEDKTVAKNASGEKLADDRTLITAAYAQAYARQPTEAELTICAKFIADQVMAIAQHGTAAERETLPEPLPKSESPAHAAAVVDFCHALLNSNEFLYVD
ncbi:MAG TPA: DUF1549 and DUF1553 domain-containing protein [Pirellulales bacterium]|jgi:hypothetical protein|nr:DUF1549 and DUF1553 domain-containing protein [Pirellulales bacterium]